MAQFRADVVDVYPFRRGSGGVEFLLLRRAPGRTLAGTWQAVHGRIEPGETAVAAALRELREETGLSPTGFWQIDHVNVFYVARDDCVLMCPCFAAQIADDGRVRLSAEHTACRWVAADEAPRVLMWPGQRRAVREILSEIVAPGPAEPHLRVPPHA